MHGQAVTLEAAPAAWTALRSAAPDSTAGFAFTDARFVGQCVGEGGPGCPADAVQRVAYDFADLDDPSALLDGVVESATLSVPVAEDQACGLRKVTVRSLVEVTAETTWTSSRWGSILDDASDAECGGGRRVEFDVADGVTSALRLGRPLAFGLSAADESCRGCGRASFGPDATLSVVLRMTDVAVPLGTSWPPAPCVVGDDRPFIRSTTPELMAELSNDRSPFPSAMSAVFSVIDIDTGHEVWRSQETTARQAPAVHTVQVPGGILGHGRTYAWRVEALLPSGRFTEPVGCELSVDVVAPGTPEVTPVDGYPAVYREREVAGGIFQTGGFRFDPAAQDDDVAYYSYGWGPVLSDRADPGEVVEFTPTSGGLHTLQVRAVDRAGNTSPVRRFEVYVAFPIQAGGTWHFDELAGLDAGNTLSDQFTLRLSGEDVWTPGIFGELGGDPADGGLLFDDSADLAVTEAAVVDPAGDLTVAAFVKPAADGQTATLLGQGSGFALGMSHGDSCGPEPRACWTFSVATGDGAERTTVVSDAAVTPGRWTFVVGIRNTATSSLDLWTCDVEGFGRPEVTSRTGLAPLDATIEDPFHIGGGAWRGTVDGVRVLDAVQSEDKIRRWCTGAP